MDKLIKLRKSVLHEGDLFGWEIVCYEDVTKIIYYENGEDGTRTQEEAFDITTGYDVQVFEEAIRLRKEETREDI